MLFLSYVLSKMKKIDFSNYSQFHFSRNRSKTCQRNVFETVNVFTKYSPNNKIETLKRIYNVLFFFLFFFCRIFFFRFLNILV